MTWWQRLWQSQKLDEQLDKELRFHIEEHTARLVSDGLEPDEARRQAHIAVGGPEQVKESCRDERGTRWLEDVWQDLRYALRTIRQRPGFAAVVALTLAVGIGSTTLMFTVLNGVLLNPFPYRNPDRLFTLQEKTAKATQFGDLWAFAYPNFLDVRSAVRSIDSAAWRFTGGTVSQPGDAEYIQACEVSAEFLSILGISPAIGRDFTPQEDQAGAVPVALISDSLWKRKFGGREDAMGATLTFNGQQYAVVGVLPTSFQLADDSVDLMTLIGQDAAACHESQRSPPANRSVGPPSGRRDSGYSAFRTRGCCRPSGRRIPALQRRSYVHRRSATSEHGECRFHDVDLVWRRDSGAGDWLRQHCQPPSREGDVPWPRNGRALHGVRG